MGQGFARIFLRNGEALYAIEVVPRLLQQSREFRRFAALFELRLQESHGLAAAIVSKQSLCGGDAFLNSLVEFLQTPAGILQDDA